MAWPKDWSPYVGTSVVLEGVAVEDKLGPVLQGDGGAIWIDELASWPSGFYTGGDRGKHVRVAGTVIDRYDLPVFVPKDGEPPAAGIPIREDADVHEASRRFLLRGVRWTVLE
jgi:hypothetical protein